MLFGKRRWAVRVIKEAGGKVGKPAAVELVDLLVAGAKHVHHDLGGPPDFDDLDLVVRAAKALPGDEAAVERLTSRIGYAPDQAGLLLKGVADAAVRVYEAEGRSLGAKRPDREREPWPPHGAAKA
jgi:hypothetical protein